MLVSKFTDKAFTTLMNIIDSAPESFEGIVQALYRHYHGDETEDY